MEETALNCMGAEALSGFQPFASTNLLALSDETNKKNIVLGFGRNGLYLSEIHIT